MKLLIRNKNSDVKGMLLMSMKVLVFVWQVKACHAQEALTFSILSSSSRGARRGGCRARVEGTAHRQDSVRQDGLPGHFGQKSKGMCKRDRPVTLWMATGTNLRVIPIDPRDAPRIIRAPRGVPGRQVPRSADRRPGQAAFGA